MAGTNGNGQRVNAGAFYEIQRLVRIGVGSAFGGHFYFIFHASQFPKLCFYYNASSMGIVYDFFCFCYVFFIVEVGTVEHNGSKASFDTSFTNFKISAMVQMQCDVQTAFFYCSIHHVFQILWAHIVECAFRNLQNYSGVLFFASIYHCLNDFHVVDVEGADGIVAGKRLFKHFFGRNKSHGNNHLSYSR